MNLTYFSSILRILSVSLLLSLTGCNYFQGLQGMLGGGGGAEQEERPLIRFSAARQVSTMPWYLAAQEGVFERYNEEYKVNITFEPATDYEQLLNQFIAGELDAMVISNIDAIARLVSRGIEADAILICAYSEGEHALLFPSEMQPDLAGQSVALKIFSASHYLLDRYLLKNQIGFEQVDLLNTLPDQIPQAFEQGHPVAASNPVAEKLRTNNQAKVLFDSHSIPRELLDLLVVRRQPLAQTPDAARALLAVWFNQMEGLQQAFRRANSLDQMAKLAEMDTPEFENQLADVILAGTDTRALSDIRDRRMRKAMRHIRYFMERHKLIDANIPVSDWVSYPGRTPPALLHFNAEPLQDFVRLLPEAES